VYVVFFIACTITIITSVAAVCCMSVVFLKINVDVQTPILNGQCIRSAMHTLYEHESYTGSEHMVIEFQLRRKTNKNCSDNQGFCCNDAPSMLDHMLSVIYGV